MQFRQAISISELIEMVRNKRDLDETYCIYGTGDSSHADLATSCFLDDYAEITDDDEEIDTPFVTERGLWLWWRDELVQDVIFNALHQDSQVTDEKILQAIKYYNEFDTFLDL